MTQATLEAGSEVYGTDITPADVAPGQVPAPVDLQIDGNGIYRPTEFGERLRSETIGVRLSCRKFFTRKSLSSDQVQRTADQFKADRSMVSAAKKLLDVSFEPYRNVTKLITAARHVWWNMSIDYPVTGIRLIRKSLVESFRAQMEALQTELNAAKIELETHYATMREEAKLRLGELFNECDYPENLSVMFSLDFDFPNVEPSQELLKLNPDLYKAEQARISARFDEAVAMAEQAFTEELAKLVTHLQDKLTGTKEDGTPRILKASAVENLNDFFGKFKTMSIGSNPELDAAVKTMETMLAGIDVKGIRKDAAARKSLADSMAGVAATLTTMVEARPSRMIDLSDD